MDVSHQHFTQSVCIFDLVWISFSFISLLNGNQTIRLIIVRVDRFNLSGSIREKETNRTGILDRSWVPFKSPPFTLGYRNSTFRLTQV